MRTTALIVLLGLASPSMAITPQQPPAATAPAKKPVYDESADAKQQIAAAVAKAKAENRRVLIQWGGNWCPWCIRLHELMGSDKNIRKELMYEYDVVYVDSGKPKGKNVDLAKSLGAEINGYPYLTILGSDGKPVAQAETEQFEVKAADGTSKGVEAGHDREKVLKFLKDHEAPHLAAKAVLDQGLAKAKSEGKTAFVHFGAPWCIWCHRLEDWMAQPEIAAILAKDFVNIEIDTERTEGGQEMLDTMSAKKSGGIPWCVFMNGDGKAIVNSNGGKDGGNIGYPAAPEEIAHFQTMLNKAKKNMTDADVAALVKSLTEAGEKYK